MANFSFYSFGFHLGAIVPMLVAMGTSWALADEGFRAVYQRQAQYPSNHARGWQGGGHPARGQGVASNHGHRGGGANHGRQGGANHGHPAQASAAQPTSAGSFQRPYPYHLDYYRMKYGGSYAPYFGNLYGPPAVYVAPPYGGAYGGGFGFGGYGNFGPHGPGAWGRPTTGAGPVP